MSLITSYKVVQSNSENCRRNTQLTSLIILICEMNVCRRVSATKLLFKKCKKTKTSHNQVSACLGRKYLCRSACLCLTTTVCHLTGVVPPNKQQDSRVLFIHQMHFKIQNQNGKNMTLLGCTTCTTMSTFLVGSQPPFSSGVLDCTSSSSSNVLVCFLEGLIHMRKKTLISILIFI